MGLGNLGKGFLLWGQGGGGTWALMQLPKAKGGKGRGSELAGRPAQDTRELVTMSHLPWDLPEASILHTHTPRGLHARNRRACESQPHALEVLEKPSASRMLWPCRSRPGCRVA